MRSELAGECAPELIEIALERLLESGRLIEDGPNLALPDHAPRLTDEEEAARARLQELIAETMLLFAS